MGAGGVANNGGISSDSGHSSPMSAAGHSPLCQTRSNNDGGSIVEPLLEGADSLVDGSSPANNSLDRSGKQMAPVYILLLTALITLGCTY